MIAYITKYALTKGIMEIEGQIKNNNSFQDEKEFFGLYHGEGREWHLTKEEAIFKAEEMKQNRLKALDKQIIKLLDLTFT